MKKSCLKYMLLLPILIAWGCSDDKLLDDPSGLSGEVKYRFVAEIGDSNLESRVSLDPDSHGHGYDHKHNLALHWEEGDEVVLTPDDNDTQHYKFTAVKYFYDKANGTFVPNESETTEIRYVFESTDFGIPSPFTGTAVYKPRESAPTETEELKIMDEHGVIKKETRPIFRQISDGDTKHLRYCQSMSARLEAVDFSLTLSELASIQVVEKPILFVADGEYAYLKIIVNRFNYPIYENGRVWLYDMDETSEFDDATGLDEWETPLMVLRFGENKNDLDVYFDVPQWNSTNSSKFDTYTKYYLGDEIIGTFYIPVKKYSIQGGHYLAAVLQCGKHGDLYVWEKKVAQDMTFEVGKLYTLDYTDREPEFAVKFAENTYFRTKFLGQSNDGTSCGYYTLLGDKITKDAVAQNPNRIAYPDGGSRNLLNGDDVKDMRDNNGAFIFSGSQMSAIYPNTKKVKWKQNSDGSYAKESITENGVTRSWLIMQVYKTDNTIYDVPRDKCISATGTDLYSTNYIGNAKTGYFPEHIDQDDVVSMTDDDYKTDTWDYMSKITKGIINRASKLSTGYDSKNSIEYVLQDRFDPVLHDSKTSRLWRAPYGMDIMSMCQLDKSVKVEFVDNLTKLLFKAPDSGHLMCLPYMGEYGNCNAQGKLVGNRSTRLDGEGTSTTSGINKGTWMPYVSGNYRFSGTKSVRSFGSDNPAYMQTINIQISLGGKTPEADTEYSLANVQNFDYALPILPVFRWKPKTSSVDKLVKW